MKRILLFLILIPFCLILCGCDTNYKISIDENLIVSEEIGFSYDYDGEYIESEKSELEYFKQTASESNYQITDSSTIDKIDILFKRKSDIVGFNSPIFSKIYTYFDTSCNEDKCSITSIALKDNTEGDGRYMNYKISITVPYKVLKQNADEIDLKNNTYIWYYIVGGQQSNIELAFEKQGKNVIETNKKNSNIMLIVYIIIGTIVFGFIGSIVYRIIMSRKPRL